MLEKYGMIECKSMATSMEINFKKLCGEVAGTDLVKPFEYKELIGAMMFSFNVQTYAMQ